MLEDLLDEDLLNQSAIRHLSVSNWSVFILLWAGIGLCIALGHLMSWPLLAAVVALAITSFLFYRRQEQLAILLLGGSLLAAAGDLLMFFPFSFSLGFIWLLPLDFVPIIVLILLMATNWEVYRELVVAIKGGDQQEIEADKRLAKTNRFLVVFRNKTTQELALIVEENRLVPEAIRAAEELLAGRGRA